MSSSPGDGEDCGLLDEVEKGADQDVHAQGGTESSARWQRMPSWSLIAATVILLFVLALPLLNYMRREKHTFQDPPALETNHIAIDLHPELHSTRDPTTLFFNWTVTLEKRAPDGVEKQIYLVNGLFPGPTIEARSGDRIIVNVINGLESEGVAVHWHGLRMKGSNHMDGAVGFTQCPILPGKSFTYNFTIGGDEHGTFWWHSHSQVQRGDGLYGGLVVHRPNKVESVQPQPESLLLIGDWFHRAQHDVLSSYADYASLGNEPVPDSLLVNGHGRFNCSSALPSRPVICHLAANADGMPIFGRRRRRPTRLRIVNSGTVAGFILAVQGASLQPTAVDGGCSVDSRPGRSIGILYPGERVDAIMVWNQDETQRPLLSVYLDTENFSGFPNEALSPNQTFAALPEIEVSKSSQSVLSLPTKSGHVELQKLVSASHTSATLAAKADETIVFYVKTQKLSRFENRPLGFFNHTSWVPQTPPLLSLNRTMWNSNQLIPFIGMRSRPTTVDLIINNLDDGSHPIHLHGNPFYVLASYKAPGRDGWGSYNPFDSEPLALINSVNPLVKDTVAVPRRGYVHLRLMADNPGVWMLHCHMLVHMGTGMVAGLHVGDRDDFNHSKSIDKSAASLCAREDGKDGFG